ncbi:hypothetical protein [Prescottella equi]|uniref:hypothetical protein n=1 Tax=Rhodococcus hoagii TaxID=43767 RepID=UPI00197F472C|nr:hypothetical protein [Prescottella equi]
MSNLETEHYTVGPTPTGHAIRFLRIETTKLLVERWGEGDDRPSWFDGREGLTSVTIAPHPKREISVQISVQSGSAEVKAAVACDMAVYYEVAVDGELVEDASEFLASMSEKKAAAVANRGIHDLSPSVREAVLSATARVLPERPLALPVPLGMISDNKMTWHP